MGIEKAVEEYKKTKDKRLFDYIVSYYKPSFKEKVRKNYNKNYDDEIDEIFEELVSYYFDNELKEKLTGFLRKRSKTIFNVPYDYTQIIHSEEKGKVRKHYIDKMYNDLKSQSKQTILLDDELYELVTYDVNIFFNNYLSNNKISEVSNYFNSQIYRKIIMYKNEERLILSYARNVKVNDRIKLYFYDKYFYLLEENLFDSFDDYKKYINEILLSGFYLSNFNFEIQLRKKSKINKNNKIRIVHEELEKLKDGKEVNVVFIKEHYSYIKNLIFEKFKDSVFISEEELKSAISLRYDKYFDAAIKFVKGNENASISRYINTRISDSIKKNKRFFTPFYVDKDEKEKNINESKKLIDKYFKKYRGLFDDETLLKIIENLYYENAEDFYKKKRKTKFYDFVRNHISEDLKKIKFLDADEVCKDIKKI